MLPSSLALGEWYLHNNSLENMKRGVLRRFLLEQNGRAWIPVAQPPIRTIYDLCATTRRLLCQDLPVLQPYSLREFPELYTGKKRALYRQAVDDIERLGWDDKWAELKVFVKKEKIDFEEKPDPDPRIIYPRDPRFNVLLGVYVRKLEHSLYSAIDSMWQRATKRTHRVVMKGLNAVQRGAEIELAWNSFRRPVAVLVDGSRFERHVSQSALVYEHDIYARFYHGRDRGTVRELCVYQLRNRGSGRACDGNLKFERLGGRASGDINTASGNVLIVTSLCYEFIRRTHIPFKDVSLIDDGDDHFYLMEEQQLAQFQRIWPRFWPQTGFHFRVEGVVRKLESILFCRTQPVRTPEGVVMVRRPQDVLGKDLNATNPVYKPTELRTWMRAIGDCGMSVYCDQPVYSEMYRMLIRESAGKKSRLSLDPTLETGLFWLAQGVTGRTSVVADSTRLSFFEAFGITPEMQINMEDYYRGMRSSVDVMSEVFDRLREAPPRPFIYMA